jgi:hypothetical protein
MMRKGGEFGKKEEGGEKRREYAGKEGELREEGGGRKNAAKGKEGKKEGCNIARRKGCRYVQQLARYMQGILSKEMVF